MALYNPKSPAAGHGAFVGREQFVRSLVTGVESGRSFVVVGGPRIGKTSILRHAEFLLRERMVRDPACTRLVMVNLGAEHYDGDLRRSGPLILRTLHHALYDPRLFAGHTPPPPPQIDLEKARDVDEALRTSIKETLEAIRGTAGWSRYALVLDDAGPLTERSAEPLLSFLAKITASDEAWTPHAMITAGGRLLREALRERRSPLRTHRLLTLNAFRETETETLTRRGFPTVHRSTVRSLSSMTGNHPYLLTEFLRRMEQRGGAGDPRGLAREIAAEVEPFFSELWDEFDMGRRVTYRGVYSAPEHALMQYAIDTRGDVAISTAEREIAIRPLKEYAEFLEYIGVFARRLTGNQTHYRASSDLFNQWYAKRIRE